MSILSRFQAIPSEAKDAAVENIVRQATPDFDFFFLLSLSVVMATFGLIAGNETVVIGSMLLAPLMSPILGLGLGVAMSGPHLISKSINTLARATLIGLGVSVAVTLLFSFGSFGGELNEVILSRTEPSLLFFLIAVISGLVVSFALVQPDISASLPGAAVAVALIPPLAVIGIGLANLDLSVAAGAAVMFGINVLGIVGASMVSFSLMDVHYKRNLAEKTLKQEEKKIEKEAEIVKKIDEEIAAQ